MCVRCSCQESKAFRVRAAWDHAHRGECSQAAGCRHGIQHLGGALLLVGLARVFELEKGPTYYFHTWTFLAKLALFVIIGLVSIVPTIEFLRWRPAVKTGKIPAVSAEKIKSIGSIIHYELIGVVLILLCAALMAKGIGLML